MLEPEPQLNSVEIENFTEIPVPAPPTLMQLIGYPGSARLVALYYMGSKATWNDGLASATFSFYNAYAPLINHPVMAIHLFDVDLGSDDARPTHALLCDRTSAKLFVGEFDHVQRALSAQISDEERRAAATLDEALFKEPATLDDFLSRGMFEIFARPSAERQARTDTLLEWLDRAITNELIESYLIMLKADDLRAYQPLQYISARFGRKAH